ncbi:MBL fold metallo-hydrolase [Rathayibacter soli]|uniref:MBL fold metallo-hydrolase n=1 Tax=Rathayibacter soli TaxID=3144168 RepID=UPI0027E3DE24|nr:MBL fold metallo-hydrolase [Glaciibacter superstes]
MLRQINEFGTQKLAYDLNVRDIIGSLYQLERPRAGNAYLIELDDRSVLVDTGLPSSAGAVVSELAGARIRPITDIVLTHYDADHMGGAAAVQNATGARVWLGAADIAIVRREAAPSTRMRRWMLNSGFLGRADLPEFTELPDHDEVEIAPGVTAVPAPGHTPGHHVVRWSGVAFIGDAARISRGRLVRLPNFLTSTRPQAEMTIQAITASHPRLVCPGHGRPGPLK